MEVAIELADIADSVTLEHFQAGARGVRVKPDRSLVSETDFEVERRLREHLASCRPSDMMIGEEYGDSGSGARRWIIDPLDHTNNFARGLPFFSTLIALEQDAEIVVGIASAPAIKGRWRAERGQGAWRDDSRLSVSNVDDMREAHFSYAALAKWSELGLDGAIMEFSRTCRYEWGSGGWWAHMMVAEGKMDFSLDPWGHLWDLAAVQIIIEEAGGFSTDIYGERRIDRGNLVVSNGHLHSAVVEALSYSKTT